MGGNSHLHFPSFTFPLSFPPDLNTSLHLVGGEGESVKAARVPSLMIDVEVFKSQRAV